MARIGQWYLLDRLGWPVVTIKGRPVVNAIRLLLHTRRVGRWTPPTFAPDPNTDCSAPITTGGTSE